MNSFICVSNIRVKAKPDYSKVEPRVKLPEVVYNPPKSRCPLKSASLPPEQPTVFKSHPTTVNDAAPSISSELSFNQLKVSTQKHSGSFQHDLNIRLLLHIVLTCSFFILVNFDCLNGRTFKLYLILKLWETTDLIIVSINPSSIRTFGHSLKKHTYYLATVSLWL